MQTIIQKIIIISPGNTKEFCIPKSLKFQVKASNGILIIERFVRFIIEKAIITAAASW